jgi:hypothetical protein
MIMEEMFYLLLMNNKWIDIDRINYRQLNTKDIKLDIIL